MCLLNSKGNVITENTEIANALNFRFHGVFNKEDTTLLPQVDFLSEMIMGDINISSAGVQELLETLDPHKSLGLDISPGILKQLAAVLSPFCLNLFNNLLIQVNYQYIGKLSMSVQYTNHDVLKILVIVVLYL